MLEYIQQLESEVGYKKSTETISKIEAEAAEAAQWRSKV